MLQRTRRRPSSDIIETILVPRSGYRRLATSAPLPLPTKLRKIVTTFIKAPLARWYAFLAPQPHDLSSAALSASSLLTTFAAASLASGRRFNLTEQQRLDAALTALLRIRANVSEQYPVQSEELTVDAGCIVCFVEVVDMVLMPCRHMIACAVGHFSGV